MQDGQRRRCAAFVLTGRHQLLSHVYMFLLDRLRTLARGQASEGSGVALGVAFTSNLFVRAATSFPCYTSVMINLLL